MPLARFPGAGGGGGPTVTDQLVVVLPGVAIDPAPPVPIVAGHVIAIVDVAGAPIYKLVSALAADHPELYYGVVVTASPIIGTSFIATGRGSRVTPLVELAVPLVVDGEVFLSSTPGEVTQIVPSASGSAIVRVGFAITATDIVLNTDFRQVIP